MQVMYNQAVVDRSRCHQRRPPADHDHWSHVAGCTADSVRPVCSWSHDMVGRLTTDSVEHTLQPSPTRLALNDRRTTPPDDASANDETAWRTPLYSVHVHTVYTVYTRAQTASHTDMWWQHCITHRQQVKQSILHSVHGQVPARSMYV